MDFPMDFATLLKFAHVFAAILWVGGGFTVIIAGIVLQGRASADTQLAVVRATVLLAPRLFIPASVFTLASGVTLLFVAGWGWQPFTVLGLAGVIFTARVACESNAMTSPRSSGCSTSTAAFAAAFAISIGVPFIEPERSMTSDSATPGMSFFFSLSMRTGRIRSIVECCQPPSA
jgi:hypothetical protein